jgi:hypothetical protein
MDFSLFREEGNRQQETGSLSKTEIGAAAA